VRCSQAQLRTQGRALLRLWIGGKSLGRKIQAALTYAQAGTPRSAGARAHRRKLWQPL